MCEKKMSANNFCDVYNMIKSSSAFICCVMKLNHHIQYMIITLAFNMSVVKERGMM